MDKKWESREHQGYLSEFLSLKCVGDVWNVVNPLGTKAQKEITESMAMIHVLRSIVLRRPMELHLIDMCAGNALTSVLAAHLLPIALATAVDKRERKRRWDAVKRFRYIVRDIKEFEHVDYRDNTGKYNPHSIIVMAVHPCKTAPDIVKYFIQSEAAEYLLMMPCCRGGVDRFVKRFTTLELEKFGRYEQWCLYLAELCRESKGVKVQVYRDKKCISPCNIMIVAEKEVRDE